MGEFGERRRGGNKLKGVAGVGATVGMITAIGMLEGAEGAKPTPTEVFDGTIKVSRDARIREWPDIPHGSSQAPNVYGGWPWEGDEIYINKPRIVESYDPANGSPTGGIWIQFPVEGDQKFVAWSPANAGIVEALPGGKFIKGQANPDGSFEGVENHNFKPEELSVVSVQPPELTPQK